MLLSVLCLLGNKLADVCSSIMKTSCLEVWGRCRISCTEMRLLSCGSDAHGELHVPDRLTRLCLADPMPALMQMRSSAGHARSGIKASGSIPHLQSSVLPFLDKTTDSSACHAHTRCTCSFVFEIVHRRNPSWWRPAIHCHGSLRSTKLRGSQIK